MYDCVELCFMIPGHTKNICDCSFGHCKRCFRSRDVLCPADMMKVIEDSSKSTTCIPSASVTWKDWKEVLSFFFKIPSTFKITTYQCFIFKKNYPGIVHARKLSSSQHESKFNLLQDIEGSTNNLYSSILTKLQKPASTLKWKSLTETSSPKHSNRKNYLQQTILNVFYKHNEELQEKFFANGV